MKTLAVNQRTSRGFLATIVFLLAYVAARGMLEQGTIGDTIRVLVALLPVPPFVWLLWSIMNGVRTMDELEQRIQLEALALAFPLALILLLTLGLLEIAIDLPPQDLSYRHVWAMMPLLYFLGLTLARKRYR